jgi:hypothetical protein
MESIVRACLQQLQRFHPNELTCVVWALAKMGYMPAPQQQQLLLGAVVRLAPACSAQVRFYRGFIFLPPPSQHTWQQQQLLQGAVVRLAPAYSAQVRKPSTHQQAYQCISARPNTCQCTEPKDAHAKVPPLDFLSPPFIPTRIFSPSLPPPIPRASATCSGQWPPQSQRFPSLGCKSCSPPCVSSSTSAAHK